MRQRVPDPCVPSGLPRSGGLKSPSAIKQGEIVNSLAGETLVDLMMGAVSGCFSPVPGSGKDETPAKKVKVSSDWEKNGDMELNPNVNVYVQKIIRINRSRVTLCKETLQNLTKLLPKNLNLTKLGKP